jgi:hypothetical protein
MGKVTVSRLLQHEGEEFLVGTDGERIEFNTEAEAIGYLRELGINETVIASFTYHKE